MGRERASRYREEEQLGRLSSSQNRDPEEGARLRDVNLQRPGVTCGGVGVGGGVEQL